MNIYRRWLAALLFVLPLSAQKVPLEFDIQWVNPPAEKVERLTHRTFRSASMGHDVGFNIYLPRAYDAESGRRFPVIYWLHGAGGNESSSTYLAAEYDRAIAQGVLPPVIVVFPNGGRRSEYRDWPDQNVMSETMIMDELIPLIDREYRTIADRKGRAIEGMSMGGNGCIKLAFRHPEKFISVVSYAGSYKPLPMDGRLFPGIRPEQQAWIEKLAQWYIPGHDMFRLAPANMDKLDGMKIRIITGSTDVALEDGDVLHEFLMDLNIQHEYEMLLGVPHNQKMYYERAGFHGFAQHARAFAEASAQ